MRIGTAVAHVAFAVGVLTVMPGTLCAQDDCDMSSCASGAPGVSADPTVHGSWDGPFQLGYYNPLLPTPAWVCEASDPCDDEQLGIAHATLLVAGDRQGEVMFWDKRGLFSFWTPDEPCVMDISLWFSDYPGPATHPSGCAYDIFCAGSSVMADGRVFIAGGADYSPSNFGRRESVLFDPTVTDGTVDPWELGPDMIQKRYYPTVMPMLEAQDGLPFVLGGTVKSITLQDSSIAEWDMLDPSPGMMTCLAQTTAWDFTNSVDTQNPTKLTYYPRAFQLSDASSEIFIAGDTPVRRTHLCSGDFNDPGETWFLDPPAPGGTSGTLTAGPADVDRYYGNAVLLHQLAANGGKDRVLVFGGSSGCFLNAIDSSCCDGSVTVHSCVKELDYQPGGTSLWVDKADMLCPRVFSNAVVLPTGDIFLGRGTATDLHNDNVAFDPLPHAELYTPGPTKTTGSGSSLYTASVSPTFVPGCEGAEGTCAPGPFDGPPARTYHTISLLLPDATVLVAGGDNVPGNPSDPLGQCGDFGPSAHSVEIYSPPYLHQGWRPRITLAPDNIEFGEQFNVNWKATINSEAQPDRLVLVRPGSVTHHFDPNQRYIELELVATSQTLVPGGNPVHHMLAVAPNDRLAPAGFYMLFVIAKDGSVRVPSQAVFVELG